MGGFGSGTYASCKTCACGVLTASHAVRAPSVCVSVCTRVGEVLISLFLFETAIG